MREKLPNHRKIRKRHGEREFTSLIEFGLSFASGVFTIFFSGFLIYIIYSSEYDVLNEFKSTHEILLLSITTLFSLMISYFLNQSSIKSKKTAAFLGISSLFSFAAGIIFYFAVRYDQVYNSKQARFANTDYMIINLVAVCIVLMLGFAYYMTPKVIAAKQQKNEED